MSKTLRYALIVAVVTAVFAGGHRSVRADTGYALDFDGVSDFVVLAQNSAMLGAGWSTVKSASVWVRPTGSAVCTGPEPGTCDAIVGDRPRTWGIARGPIGGTDRIWVWNFDGNFDRIAIAYTPGEWVQIGLVHSAGTLRAYKNGALVGSVASGANPSTGATGVLHFGGIINNATRNWTFDGEIDELQLWSTARSDAEMAQAMNGPLTGNEAGLAAYYRMSGGSGSTVADDSVNSWTGTLRDGTSDVPADGPIAWVSPGIFPEGAPINTSPVANPQAVATAEDTAAAITLTGSDADGDALSYRIVTPPTSGTLSGTPPSVTYTPGADINGADAFSFVVNDGRVDSAAATVALTITPVNDPPVGVDDAGSTTADTPVDVSVLANDTDVEGDALSISAVADPPNGVATDNGTQITYVPDPGFIGMDSFTYTLVDGNGGEAQALVTVDVSPPGESPGYALRFDGTSDFVQLSETSSMLSPGWQDTKTVELWVKPTGTSFCNALSPGNCDAIFGDRPRWWGISRGNVDGVDRIWVWNWDGNSDAVAIDFTPGEWIHVAMVHSGGMLSAYKNGVLVGSVPSGTTQQPNIATALPWLQLGGVINTPTRNWTFSGDLDEVRIWTLARTAAELAADMNRPLSGSEAGLAAYYRMSNESGTVLTDDSGHGWTGALRDGCCSVPADGPITWVPSGAFR
jgi:hypothetical protein